ncbi:uncharacterized protein F5891DRAFT_333762 [Suillus fuscotomentosus]|uniref:C2H2-type domain-containing protein n=1 Tax=Suillus fuscotomentosus TaxID=1912939 RepID=A0AAD4E5H2_9AGAM|nr:uncharacterized protein F5891DRAFT_333762 [Suillus fuscotomentosus]KAG1899917.1 hypothetical protein F5891DRAFT_333762 [Suillus fuscotomentosus]
MIQCDQCDRSFRSTQALFAHCRDRVDHPFCEDCDRLFYTFTGLDQHMQNAAVHHSDCESYEYASESDDDDDEEPPRVVIHEAAWVASRPEEKVGCNRWFVDLLGLMAGLIRRVFCCTHPNE